jgi:hypothetical protein
MMKQWNNLHCVANKSEIFQLKKDWVEMFSAYILKVNFKNFIIFNLYFTFCFGPHVFAGNASLRVFGVVPWLCIIRKIILHPPPPHTHTHTHTHTQNHTSSTPHKQLFASHYLHTWPILKNLLFIRGTWRDWTAGRLTIGSWAVQLHVWHPWLALKTSLILISLDAPAFLLLLSQTSSNVWFGGRNPAVLRALIADCLLRNDYSVRLIITQLEQVVMQCNVISYQFYGSTIYAPVYYFLSTLHK